MILFFKTIPPLTSSQSLTNHRQIGLRSTSSLTMQRFGTRCSMLQHADLTADAYRAHQRHQAAPKPLSSREQELSDLRVAENTAATYEGSRARASHVGNPVGFQWADEAQHAVSQLVERRGVHSRPFVHRLFYRNPRITLVHRGYDREPSVRATSIRTMLRAARLALLC
ncbi:hypothetical protein FA13DRAFT_1206175 [Coprinellus micaceus]|uniref:Uncharacterized protein n=1 Tax=Coprinellus micaceus TaxID=71717 RepID=A0A4Y7TNY1_COPMI|nr:hypothetical protein FA13DRAFT_1206175 [Coprinellus micaceus]